MVVSPRRRRVFGKLFPALMFVLPMEAGQIDLIGPDGSGSFGLRVTALPNGHFLVADPDFDLYEPDWSEDVGAVHHYDASWQWLGALTGTSAADHVGAGGITVLASGDYVVASPDHDGDAAADTGAVTRCSQSGFGGQWIPVSSTNSLTGSTSGDRVGSSGVTAIPGGGHVVRSSFWNHGTVTKAGAVTGCGPAGPVGPVSASNSLVGSSQDDRVGEERIILLGAGGNYLVPAPDWDNQGLSAAGAVTWSSGAAPVTGPISASNSLVGTSAGDQVGSGGIKVLANGNFVVSSPLWDLNASVTDAGAATWGSSSGGVSGAISAANSLVGSHGADQISSAGIFPLPNGHYVVASPSWDSPSQAGMGAATWCDGASGRSGEISSANSLTGTGAGDNVGVDGIVVLSDGDYVVVSTSWDNGGSANAGAVTWCPGATGRIAAVTSSNSITGSQTGDRVGGGGITPLSNGHYVIASPLWNLGSGETAIADAGIVTWGNGSTGGTGQVGTGYSVHGTVAAEMLGSEAITALADGHYLIAHSQWDSPAAADAGAVRWCSGTMPTSGPISASNSLIGTTAGDRIGSAGIAVLAGGRHVISSPGWDRGTTVDAGAVTWCPGGLATTGELSETNSLVGSTAGDQIGATGIRVLPGGNYVVTSSFWDLGSIIDAGAVTWCDATIGRSGPVSESNSLVGSTAADRVGSGGIAGLSGGRFVVISPLWNRGGIVDSGAATWCAGDATLAAAVAPSNSLTGSAAGDQVGSGGVSVFADGSYLVRSPRVDNGPIANAAAITPGAGTGGIVGAVSAANSILGLSAAGFLKASPFLSGGHIVVGQPRRGAISRFLPGNSQLVNGQSRDFGTVTVGSSTALTFKVACAVPPDPGASTISLSAPFAVTPESVLAEGNLLVFEVTFTPSSGGPFQSALQVQSGTTSLTATVTGTGNTPPDFAGFSFGTPFESLARLDPFKVLAAASDADGDALTITAAGNSQEEGSATIVEGAVFYEPPPDFTGVDFFEIIITDARGAHRTGTVTATITDPFNSQSGNPVTVTPRHDGRRIVSFRGVPAHSYIIERSLDLTTWTELDVGTAGPTGRYEFVDPQDANAPVPPAAFYRLVNP